MVLAAGCGGSAAPRQAVLAFASTRDGDYAIFGLDADGKHEWRLTEEKGDPATPEGLFFQLQPSWSPDGDSIAFASKRDGPAHIFVMRADGSDTHPLTTGPADDTSPAWSPKGGRIAFTRDGEVYVIAAGGGKPQRVTRALGGDAADPAWSPDAQRIVYALRRPGLSIRELWIVNADGSGAHQLTQIGQVSGHPAWSPDGSRIAFHSNARSKNFEIYSIGPDGSALRRETSSTIDTIDPAWSPNGAKIAFSRDGAIWTVDRAGREEKLTSAQNDAGPAWRPTG